MNARLTTYADLVSHVVDYMGVDVSPQAERMSRRAVLSAVRDVSKVRKWSYFYTRGRVATVDSYSTGTVEYDHTGGANERQLTLTTGTWPTWARYGVVVIDSVAYEVAERVSDSILTLSAHANPGEDIAAGEEYQIYRDTYPLPTDLVAMDEAVMLNQAWTLNYVHPSLWLAQQRITNTVGTPKTFTIMGDPNYFGVMAMRLFPAPSTAENIDFIYHRRMRPLTIEEYEAGTVSVSASGTTVTGTDTVWTSSMVGSVIRFSDVSNQKPSGMDGQYPYTMERTITAVGSATSLTIDEAADQAFTGVAYAISDPVDIEEGAMLTFLLRECERQARIMRRMKTTVDEERQYAEARTLAFEADCRSSEQRAAGQGIVTRARFADMPYDSSV